MSELDKINIYVPREVGELLDSDNEMFEVFKPDGKTVNRNHFLTQLVTGYYDTYARELQGKNAAILDALSPFLTDRAACDQIASSILDQISLPRTSKRVGRNANLFMFGGLLATLPDQKRFEQFEASLPTSSGNEAHR